MASYKRKSEDFSVERKEVFIPTAQWKKSCDGGLHSHPGVLQQFFRDLGMWESRQQPKVEEILPAFTGYLRSVSDQAWACFGELNLLLGSFTHKFSEVDVRHMHSYTRCNKERVFEKLVRSEEASVQPTGSHAQAPLHMQMTACILERLYKDYPEAVICIYVIRPPAWMQSWWVDRCTYPSSEVLEVGWGKQPYVTGVLTFSRLVDHGKPAMSCLSLSNNASTYLT
eukprot:jgi/Botrbrau1/11994/Bobra.0115s0030.2